jgi:hypothetical protein
MACMKKWSVNKYLRVWHMGSVHVNYYYCLTNSGARIFRIQLKGVTEVSNALIQAHQGRKTERTENKSPS